MLRSHTSPPEADRAATAQAMWRRQLVLSGLAVAALVPAGGAYALAEGEWGRDPSNALVVWLAAAGAMLLLCAVLGAAVVHTARVARFTFRRGDH